MKTICVDKECANYTTYRAERVKSLFNAEYGHTFSISVDTDIDEFDWKIGVVVGASGTGKTSIGKTFFDGQIYDLKNGWKDDAPIIDSIAPDGDFNAVTSALSAVGLGSVPSWLRPFSVLSNGEQFRAGLARLLLSDEKAVILDEFTSVIDRYVARIASGAFQKACGWLLRTLYCLLFVPSARLFYRKLVVFCVETYLNTYKHSGIEE